MIKLSAHYIISSEELYKYGIATINEGKLLHIATQEIPTEKAMVKFYPGVLLVTSSIIEPNLMKDEYLTELPLGKLTYKDKVKVWWLSNLDMKDLKMTPQTVSKRLI